MRNKTIILIITIISIVNSSTSICFGAPDDLFVPICNVSKQSTFFKSINESINNLF